MKVIGLNFDKISVERLKDKAENIHIKTNIDISEIRKIESDLLKTKSELIEARFSYGVQYDPEYAKIDLGGRAILSLDPDQASDVIKEWKKKQMPEKFRIFLFNVIIRKASIKCLNLEDELNLPLHLPLPTLKPQKEK